MMTDVVESSGSLARRDDRSGTGPNGAATARTGTDDSAAAERIVAIRERIDEIDRTIIELWQERAALSQEVGATRMASGGTRLVLSREREILERFRRELGADGTQLALLLLRAGRGPL
ncbi:chorismate mutase [Micromonospora globispora]|uniref:Chorismate mutase n=1 Tax=Micromonospora globispora TaxID=1450148 RepID=A0A317JSB5_9ACTN|nr:chorismate mutase [Micromonospora globispora]PWU43731.1 chorismate mutase [Micromonospora globispora]PWU60816.1 chorismate mutase [Micromonospora globispora]RQW94807.1 chorismate mutase [Micromonospora globispora]